MDWCVKTHVGLPKSDLVCFMDVTREVTMYSKDFGVERWVIPNFQRNRRWKKNCTMLLGEGWTRLRREC